MVNTMSILPIFSLIVSILALLFIVLMWVDNAKTDSYLRGKQDALDELRKRTQAKIDALKSEKPQ